MAAHTELMAELRRQSGVDFTSERLTVRQWTNWLLAHSDCAVSNLGHALQHGVRTGRLPNVNSNGEMLNGDYRPMTNLQMVRLFARAAVSQSENTTAAGLRALQAVLGVRVR